MRAIQELGLDKLLTVPQVAEQLQVCPRTIRTLIARGDLSPTRIGKRIVRVQASEVLRMQREGVTK